VRFKELLGQKTIAARLAHTAAAGRISHAQLFVGPEGCGALALALAYIQYINCKGPKTDDSCGQCPSCRKISKMLHPDLHFVFPVAATNNIKTPVSDSFIEQWRSFVTTSPYQNINQWLEYIGVENKQGGIQKSESSEIIKKLNLKTYEAEYKCVIIWMAEKMNETCANKLLKILEEPPEKTVFILIAESTEQMLQTILSRTQCTWLPKISAAEMQQSLELMFPQSELSHRDIAIACAGSANKAMQLLSGAAENTELFAMFAQFMRHSYTKNFLELTAMGAGFAALGREKQKIFLEYSLGMLRENFAMNAGASEITRLLPDEKAFSDKFSPYVHENNIADLSNEFTEAHYHIERNGNPRIIFLDLAIKTIVAIKKTK
jgi:DNA polymerase III subunit delta'